MRRYVMGMVVALGLTVTCLAAAGLDQIAKSIVDTTLSPDHGAFINDNFAKDVASKLSRPAGDDAEDGIDFDVFTYSQDPDYEAIRKTIKSEVKQSDDSNAVIRVTFTQYDDETSAEYHLKKVGDRWLIDEVTYPDDGISLRSELGLK